MDRVLCKVHVHVHERGAFDWLKLLIVKAILSYLPCIDDVRRQVCCESAAEELACAIATATGHCFVME